MNECIFAHTESSYRSYPAYVNVSKCPNGDYELTVRSKESCAAGYMRLSRDQFIAFVDALKEEAHRARVAR